MIIILAADFALFCAVLLLVGGLFMIGKVSEPRTWKGYFINAIQALTMPILAGRALRWW